jgi:hypothetical protein
MPAFTTAQSEMQCNHGCNRPRARPTRAHPRANAQPLIDQLDGLRASVDALRQHLASSPGLALSPTLHSAAAVPRRRRAGSNNTADGPVTASELPASSPPAVAGSGNRSERRMSSPLREWATALENPLTPQLLKLAEWFDGPLEMEQQQQQQAKASPPPLPMSAPPLPAPAVLAIAPAVVAAAAPSRLPMWSWAAAAPAPIAAAATRSRGGAATLRQHAASFSGKVGGGSSSYGGETIRGGGGGDGGGIDSPRSSALSELVWLVPDQSGDGGSGGRNVRRDSSAVPPLSLKLSSPRAPPRHVESAVLPARVGVTVASSSNVGVGGGGGGPGGGGGSGGGSGGMRRTTRPVPLALGATGSYRGSAAEIDASNGNVRGGTGDVAPGGQDGGAGGEGGAGSARGGKGRRAPPGGDVDGQGDANTLFVRRASSIHTFIRPVPPDPSLPARQATTRRPQTVAGSAAASIGALDARTQPPSASLAKSGGGDQREALAAAAAAAAAAAQPAGTRRRSAANG